MKMEQIDFVGAACDNGRQTEGWIDGEAGKILAQASAGDVD